MNDVVASDKIQLISKIILLIILLSFGLFFLIGGIAIKTDWAIISGFIFIFLGIFPLYNDHYKKKKEATKADLLYKCLPSGYNYSNMVETGEHFLYADENKQKLIIVDSCNYKVNLIDFADIIGFEVNKNGQTVTKGSMGAPLVGAVAFGVVGAIVGSSFADRKTSVKNEKTDLIIQIKSFENPIIKLPVLSGFEPEYNKKTAIEQLEKFCVWLKIILEKNENKV